MVDNQDKKVGERIRKLRELLKMNQKSFAEEANLQQSQISNVERGTRDITPDIILKIRNRYHVNIDWIQEGIGKIFESKEAADEANAVAVPYYDIDVTGSVVGSFQDIREKPEYYIDFKPFNDCTAYFSIYGDSMYPRYASGEILAVKEIKNRNTIQWGEAYLVVTDETENNMRTVKTLHPYEDDKSCIVLRATNPNFRGDTVIKKSAIIGLYIVKGKIRKDQM